MRKMSIISSMLLIILCLTACSENSDTVKTEDEHVLAVKGGTNSNYPGKTYGEAFDAFFSSPTWEYFKGTKEGTDEDGDGKPDSEEKDVDVVEFTGYCTYKDVEVKALVQFTLNDDDTFTASYLSFNDVPQNMLMLAELLDTVFLDGETGEGTSSESSENVPQTAEWTLIDGDASGIVNECSYNIDELKVEGKVVYVTCTFTNNKDVSQSYSLLFHDMVSQKGVECDMEYCDDKDREVMPGAEFTLTYTATVEDEEEPITVYVRDPYENESDSITAVYAKQDNTEKSDNKVEKNTSSVVPSDFNGSWVEPISQRCNMEIACQNDAYYEITIDWGSSAWDNTHWEFTGEYDAVQGGIVYKNGCRYEEHYPENGGDMEQTEVYSDGEGLIYIKDEKLYWEDKKEGTGEAQAFVRSEALETSISGEFPDADYVLPNSDTVRLTEADIADLSLQEINYAKNEIYARHGRKFQSKELQDYFNSKYWYSGTIDGASFDDGVLSQIERDNIKLLTNAEFSMAPNGYQLDQ